MATDGIDINVNNELVQIKQAGSVPVDANPAPAAPVLELDAVREQLSSARGAQYWRSLEELTDKEGSMK